MSRKELSVIDIISLLEKEGHSNISEGITFLKKFVEYFNDSRDEKEIKDVILLLNRYISKYLNPYSKDWFEDSGLVCKDYGKSEIFSDEKNIYYFTLLGERMFNALLLEDK